MRAEQAGSSPVPDAEGTQPSPLMLRALLEAVQPLMPEPSAVWSTGLAGSSLSWPSDCDVKLRARLGHILGSPSFMSSISSCEHTKWAEDLSAEKACAVLCSVETVGEAWIADFATLRSVSGSEEAHSNEGDRVSFSSKQETMLSALCDTCFSDSPPTGRYPGSWALAGMEEDAVVAREVGTFLFAVLFAVGELIAQYASPLLRRARGGFRWETMDERARDAVHFLTSIVQRRRVAYQDATFFIHEEGALTKACRNGGENLDDESRD